MSSTAANATLTTPSTVITEAMSDAEPIHRFVIVPTTLATVSKATLM